MISIQCDIFIIWYETKISELELILHLQNIVLRPRYQGHIYILFLQL